MGLRVFRQKLFMKILFCFFSELLVALVTWILSHHDIGANRTNITFVVRNSRDQSRFFQLTEIGLVSCISFAWFTSIFT